MSKLPLEIPPYFWPYPSAVHPDISPAREVAEQYQEKYQLYWDEAQRQRMKRTNCGELSAMTLPLGSTEAMYIYAKFYMWAFSYDDEILDERPGGVDMPDIAYSHFQILRTMEVIEYPIPDTNKYGLALRGIRMDIDALAGTVAGEQYKNLMYQYITTETNKTGLRVSGRKPSLSEYITLRMYCGGAFAFPSLAIILNGQGLIPELLADRRVRVLREIVGLLGGWDNDIYSQPYEQDATGDGMNAVELLQLENNCTLQQAIYEAMSIRDRIATLYGRIRQRLLEENHDLYLPLIHSLDYYHKGHLAWIDKNDRYVDKSLAATYTFNGFRDTPLDTSFTPLPYPSITWWWEYDPARQVVKDRQAISNFS